MVKGFGHLENHQYRHFNRALGVQVEGKEHFKHLLEKGGYVPYEKGCEMAEKCNKEKVKPYNGLSKEASYFLGECKNMADRHGRIEISDRFVEGLKKHGVNIDSVSKIKGLSTHKGGIR